MTVIFRVARDFIRLRQFHHAIGHGAHDYL